jgi:hypothetical protein
MASILYRIYKEGPLGTGSLRTYYGGKKRRGTKRPEFRKSSGKIIRVCLQGLEKQGLVKKAKKGRVVTAKGQAYLNQMAKEAVGIAKQAVEERAKAGAERKRRKRTPRKRKSSTVKRSRRRLRHKRLQKSRGSFRWKKGNSGKGNWRSLGKSSLRTKHRRTRNQKSIPPSGACCPKVQEQG